MIQRQLVFALLGLLRFFRVAVSRRSSTYRLLFFPGFEAVRWQLGRAPGLVSYVGLADDRDVGVFVFVNRDPSATAPADVLRDELGEPILTAF